MKISMIFMRKSTFDGNQTQPKGIQKESRVIDGRQIGKENPLKKEQNSLILGGGVTTERSGKNPNFLFNYPSPPITMSCKLLNRLSNKKLNLDSC